MDRTVALCDKWYYFDGRKKAGRKGLFLKKSDNFPMSCEKTFTVKRKFVCPKQVNDTVTVFFESTDNDIEVFAGKNRIEGVFDGEKTVFDITKELKTGVTVITAVIHGGTVEKFFFSVKRNKE